MNYLTEASTKTQDWQKQLETLLNEVDSLIATPGASVREAVPVVMRGLHALRSNVNNAACSAKDMEHAIREHTATKETT